MWSTDETTGRLVCTMHGAVGPTQSEMMNNWPSKHCSQDIQWRVSVTNSWELQNSFAVVAVVKCGCGYKKLAF